MKFKSTLPLTGAAWMREMERQFKAAASLGPVATPEKLVALRQLCGDDRLFEQLTGGMAMKDAPAPDIFDSVSRWLTAGGDPRCH